MRFHPRRRKQVELVRQAALASISSPSAIILPPAHCRLLENGNAPAAIFTADGELIEAQPGARERLGNKLDLVSFGAGKLAREATLNGAADGETRAGPASVLKLGAGATFALLVVFGAQQDIARGAPRKSETPSVPSPEPASQPFPFRFVWETDAGGHFTLVSREFIDFLGPKTAGALNRDWRETARTLNLDPEGKIAAALAARETFSGIVLSWPVDQDDVDVVVEMSGLPVFDRDRQFKGFRGFGICRNTDRLRDIRRRRATQLPPPVVPEAESKALPFPSAPPPPAAEKPALNARERSAFQELARELSERLKRPSAKTQATAPDDFGAEPVPEFARYRERRTSRQRPAAMRRKAGQFSIAYQ